MITNIDAREKIIFAIEAAKSRDLRAPSNPRCIQARNGGNFVVVATRETVGLDPVVKNFREPACIRFYADTLQHEEPVTQEVLEWIAQQRAR